MYQPFDAHFRERGYSMIELMTVMVIIAIMTAFAVSNYHEGNRQVTLDVQANQLAQDLRKMQEWALSAHQVNGASLAGYGIYIVQGGSSYILYADSIASNNARYDAGTDVVLQTVDLNNNLEISQSSPTPVSVNYIPPDPVTKINDGLDTAMFEFRVKNTSMTRKVYVNRAGLIYAK
ncbi:MAG: prepilin-type N-terminal cleavage/methylation domain-containing protein [Candidatus Pacebacteria bacterium]|jgi:prepilin-type N-terminal cleavage/methylation domain-containing protein|nr:prepilin-type N-terminal cleavage/methylation domain-containing protein [Candidatus Paceibacterota bacterium]